MCFSIFYKKVISFLKYALACILLYIVDLFAHSFFALLVFFLIREGLLSAIQVANVFSQSVHCLFVNMYLVLI